MSVVFFLQVPLELAPTMNEYASIKARGPAGKSTFKKLYAGLDGAILTALRAWPSWHAGFREEGYVSKGKNPKPKVRRVGGHRRRVIVTRNSSRRVDELGCDVIGGKAPIDRLVAAGVLVGDSPRWLDRRGVWVPAHPKQGFLTVSVETCDEPSASAD